MVSGAPTQDGIALESDERVRFAAATHRLLAEMTGGQSQSEMTSQVAPRALSLLVSSSLSPSGNRISRVTANAAPILPRTPTGSLL